MAASKQASKQASKHTHTHAQCSPTSVGLAQARPNESHALQAGMSAQWVVRRTSTCYM